MQKKLIALAITAAFASAPAFADSTVYGVADVGFGSKAVTNLGTNIKTTDSGVQFGQDQTSRIGVKSSEDLGNGMKAMYQLEIGLGNGYTPSSNLNVDRVLTAGIDFGQGTTLVGGKLSSPLRGIVYGNDAMYGANFAGNLITHDSSLTARAVAIAVVQKFGAVTGSFAVLDHTTSKDNVADNKAGNGVEVTAVYKQDALSVSGGYRSTQATVATGPAPSSDIKTTDLIIAANYDLGMAKLYGQFAQVKADESVAPATTDKKTYETFGVNMPFTSAMNGYVELGTGKHDTGAATSPKYSAYAVGVRYSMSKHTAAYAHFGSEKEDTVSKTDQYGIGLIHTF
jgi:predicted porin